MTHAQTVTSSIEATPLKAAFHISDDTLDHVMATAYQLYQDGRFPEAEVLCRGLLAADPSYWWCYSLYAAILRRQGRLRAAITLLDRGLQHEPGQAKLLAMRLETVAALEALAALAASPTGTSSTREAQASVQEVG